MNRHHLFTALFGSSFVVVAVFSKSGLLPGDAALVGLVGGWESLAIRGISWAGSIQVWTPLVGLMGAGMWFAGKRWAACWLVATALTGEVLSLLAKTIIDRPRPANAPFDDLIATASFPSGHVVRMTVVLGVLLVLLVGRRPDWRAPATLGLLVILVGVSLSRIASGDHWPSDTVGGALLGGIIVEAATSLRQRWLPLRPGDARTD